MKATLKGFYLMNIMLIIRTNIYKDKNSMTISSTTVKNSYSGNGTLTTFNYTFKIFADSDLQVIIRDASANETVKTLTTHYTVTGAGNANGGTIVFTTGNIQVQLKL